MEFNLKSYKGHNYIEYVDEQFKTPMCNAEYFLIDVTSNEFKEIMSHTGGFVANVTTRYIKEKELNTIKYIMLCFIPLENVEMLFEFVYLDESKNILDYMVDSNGYDYYYFRNKFEDCVVERGFIFDLLEIKSLEPLTKNIQESSPIFEIEVEGRDISFGEEYFCSDYSFLNENAVEKLNKLEVKGIIFTLNFDCLNGFSFKGKFLTKDNKIVLSYQLELGIQDKNEYLIEMKKKDNEFGENDIDDNEYSFTFGLKSFKNQVKNITLYK